MEEILELVSPEQLSADGTGYNCSSPHKHACVGHARTYYGRPPPYDAKNIASLVPVSYRPNRGALHGLRSIITRVLASDLAQPELIFVGDSLLSDNWAATVAGIQRLGHTLEDMDEFLRCGVCYAAAETKHAKYLLSEAVKCNFSVENRVEERDKGLARFRNFGVRYLRRPWELVQGRMARTKAQFAKAEVVIVNCGVHANRPSEYTTMLAQVRSFLLELQNCTNATVLWQETLPQHFNCSSAGVYSHNCKTCGPIMDKNGSNWRNHHFDQWLQQEPALKRQLHIIPAFDSFFGRHDLHLQGSGDCTHFLYSPFQWRHVWDSAAKTLEFMKAGRSVSSEMHPAG